MKISVITVCYNGGNTLERMIKSVLSQGYKDLDFIIIDGKSTDQTLEIIQRYDSYISYWCSEEDAGIYDAMNKGLKHATGNVVAFLNSDDWYEPEVLNYVSEYFEKHKVDVLVGDVKQWVGDRKLPDIVENVDFEWLRLGMIFCHQTIFMSRTVFDVVGGFDLQYRISADYDLTLRAYDAGFIFNKVNRFFVNFSIDGASSLQACLGTREVETIALKYSKGNKCLQDKIRKSRDMEAIYNHTLLNWICKYEPEYIECKMKINNRKLYLWGAGKEGQQCYKLLQTAGIPMNGFVDSKRELKQLFGLEVIPPDQIPNNACICIAVKCKETFQEIAESAMELGFSDGDYVWYMDIKKDLEKYGREKYDSYILK